MIYVKRDADGQIIAVSQEALDGFLESDDQSMTEVNLFFESSAGGSFKASDLEFIRALDDVIDLLIAKNLILFTELPTAVQEKYAQRTKMRARRRDSLHLLEDEEIL